MRFRYLRCLAGPNRWAPCPVFEAELDLSEVASWSAARIQQTAARLDDELSDGQSSSNDQWATGKDAPGTPRDLATAFVQCAFRLQNHLADQISFGAIQETASPNVFLIAVESVSEGLGRAVMEGALKILVTAASDNSSPLVVVRDQIWELLCEEFPARRVGYRNLAATLDIYYAAKKRNIPTAQITPTYWGSLRLGQGSKHRRLRASEPDIVSGVARMASTDKPICNQLLREAGVPISRGCVVETVEQALAAADELGLPVAVKPADTDIGVGVALDVRTREKLVLAFGEAIKHATKVLVEQFAPGIEHRVLVIGDRVVAVTRVDPPQVVGDGVSTIAQLVERVNLDPRRGEEKDDTPWFRLKLDAEAFGVLAVDGLTIDSVPAAGQKVLVRRNPPYIKHGGVPTDMTDRIHPRTAAQAVAAAKMMQIPVCGLDVVALDIGQPLEEQRGIFVEANTGPGLWLHLAPYIEPARPVGKHIVDLLFAPGEEGRIPVAATWRPRIYGNCSPGLIFVRPARVNRKSS
jgi:cyanophycin synthetase